MISDVESRVNAPWMQKARPLGDIALLIGRGVAADRGAGVRLIARHPPGPGPRPPPAPPLDRQPAGC